MTDTMTSLKNRWGALPRWAKDCLIALGFCLFFVIQVLVTTYFFRDGHPGPPEAHSFTRSVSFGPAGQNPTSRTLLSIALIILTTAPLAFRRRFPWVTLILTTAGAVIYTIVPVQPVLIVASPMLAIYTVAEDERTSKRLLTAFLVFALIGCVLGLTYGTKRWTIELVGYLVLMVAAALVGSVRRSSRAYIREVEQRALQAEKTREEEARRRVASERLHIAREMHDVVGHGLSLIAVQAAAADKLIDSDPARAHESVRAIRTTGKEALGELRSLLTVLRGETDEAPRFPIGSLDELDTVITRVERAGIAVDLRDERSMPLTTPVSVAAYRIVQEALTNVMRHAYNARTAQVSLVQHDEDLVVTIEDDGTEQTATTSDGHGIEGMRERCEALGGTLAAEPLIAPDGSYRGFKVEALLPKGMITHD